VFFLFYGTKIQLLDEIYLPSCENKSYIEARVSSGTSIENDSIIIVSNMATIPNTTKTRLMVVAVAEEGAETANFPLDPNILNQLFFGAYLSSSLSVYICISTRPDALTVLLLLLLLLPKLEELPDGTFRLVFEEPT